MIAARSSSEEAPVLREMTAEQLISATGRGGRTQRPEDERVAEIEIYDVYGNTASVRATMAGWIDYMHIAKMDDRWVIVNVLWEPTPESKEEWGLR